MNTAGAFDIDPRVTGDGRFGLDPDGRFMVCGHCCGCACDCTLTTCLGSPFNAGEIRLKEQRRPPAGDPCRCPDEPVVIHGPDARGTYHSNKNSDNCFAECFRLAIWHCAHHDGERYVVQPKCRTNIRTHNKAYCDHLVDGYFKADGRWGSEPLDEEPFWWPSCGAGGAYTGMGGWAFVADWFEPSDANLATVYDVIAGDVGDDLPEPFVPHMLILYTRRSRLLSVCDADSLVDLLAVHLTCPGLGASGDTP